MKLKFTMSRSTRDGSTLPKGIGASLSEDQDESFSFVTCSHVYASGGNSSQVTRLVKERALETASVHVSRFKKRRRRKKQLRLASLPSYHIESIPITDPGIVVSVKVKVFYDARGYSMSSPQQPLQLPSKVKGTIKRVGEDLEPIDSINGFHIKDCLTLLPRSVVIETVFPCESACKDYYESLKSILVNHPCVMPRGKFRTPVFESTYNNVYFTAGTSPCRNKRGLTGVYRYLDDLPTEKRVLDELFRKVEHATFAYIDSKSITAIKTVKDLSGYSGFNYSDGKQSMIWTSVAFLENGYLNEHTDDDYFMGAILIITKESLGISTDPRQFFCFPGKGCAVCLRNGDILLFNPQERHCLSSRVSMDVDCIALSFYLKTAVVGGNDNSRCVQSLFQRGLLDRLSETS